MIDWLYTLPEIVLMLLPAATLAVLLFGLSWFVQHALGIRLDDPHVDFVMRVETTLFSMASLLLVFTLVQADLNRRQADALVTAESSRVDQLDRLLARYGDPKMAETRSMLKDYARSIVRDEWPAMLANPMGNERTARILAALSHRVLTIEPTTTRQSQLFGEMLKALDGTTEARAGRLNAVTLRLPALYWEVVGAAMFLLIGIICFATTNRFRMLVLGGQVVILGAFIGFVFTMDRPFQGRNAIIPDSFEQVLVRMEQRTE